MSDELIDVDQDEVLAAALAAHDAGLCTIRPRDDGSKAPMSVPARGKVDKATGKRGNGWEAYQAERPSRHTVEGWFRSCPGVGIVCGAVSGGLEMLELEGRAVAEGLLAQLVERVRDAGLKPVLDRIAAGYTERTPSGGLHWLLRVSEGDALGNLKLAQRPATPEELAEHPDERIKTLIETRGERGFTIVAPSNGSTHPTGRPWTLEAGGFDTIATITVAERDALYEVCRGLDRLERSDTGIAKIAPARLAQHKPHNGGRVGDSWMDAVVAHLAATDTMAAALERYGWRDLDRDDDQGCPLFERPGQPDAGRNGGVINERGRLVVYSTSTPFTSVLTAPPGERGPTYDLLDVYAAYEHEGDRQAAARAIAGETGIHAAWLAERDPLAGVEMRVSSSPPDGAPVAVEEVRFRPYSVAELLAEDRSYEWDVVGMLTRGTYGVDAGELKTLKSYFGLARDVALAAGVPVLGRWPVPERRRVLVFVAEGGRKAYTNRLERMAAAYGIAPSSLDGWLVVIDDVAPFSSPEFRDGMTSNLRNFAPGLVHLDPQYPFEPPEVDTHRYGQVGKMLTATHRLVAEHGATFWVTTHMNQTGNGFDLKRISGAGHGEWADSWVLLRHRAQADVDAGRFRLGLALGSRQWGGTDWNLDLNIGRFLPDLGLHDGPITWHVAPAAGPGSGTSGDLVADVKVEVLAVGRKARKPLTRQSWVTRVERRRALALVAFDELVADGQVTQTGTGKSATYEVTPGC